MVFNFHDARAALCDVLATFKVLQRAQRAIFKDFGRFCVEILQNFLAEGVYRRILSVLWLVS